MTTELKHTPGPWKIDGGRGKCNELCVWMAGEYFGGHAIATIHDGVPESAKANARLVAAAPELLAACQAIIPLLDAELDAVANWQEEAQLIRAAITKATGI